MNRFDVDENYQFFTNHLKSNILPFWIENAIDTQYGGVFTCFNNKGDTLLSTDKYVWSQGRFIWVLSKLAELYPKERKKYLEIASSIVDFLVSHSFLPDGSCAFLLTRTGKLKETAPGAGYDSSIYVDFFVVLGFSKFAAMTKNKEILERAFILYNYIKKRIQKGEFKTAPYPIPHGYRTHGIPMIALNTGYELCNALEVCNDTRSEEILDSCNMYVKEIFNNCVHSDQIIEMVGTDGQPIDSIIGSYINPGHTFEDAWFIIHHAQKIHDSTLIEMTINLIRKANSIGWDSKHGGFFQYIHKDGGCPKGDISGLENEIMVSKLTDDWDAKLWWVHSEAVYALLLGYSLSGDEKLLDSYERVIDYTFKTFPNPDSTIGEWIHIRNRKGNPMEKTVALPVKDPFHITRNIMLIIDLLIKMKENDVLKMH